MAPSPFKGRPQTRPVVVVGPHGAHIGQREFANADPGMDQPRMVHEERDETESGGIAEAEEPTPAIIEADRSGASPDLRAVLDDVVAEFSVQERSEELGAEAGGQWMIGRVAVEGTHAVLAVPVERRTAHDVAGVSHLVGVGLPSGSQILDELVEEADTAVAARQHEEPRVETTFLLAGDVLASVFDDGVVGDTVDKRRADLPAFSDHPVGVGVLGEGLGEGDERDGVPLGIDLVDGQALTGVVHLEPRPGELPTVRLGPTQHGPAEGVTGRPSGAEHLRLHHEVGRPQLGAGEARVEFVRH